MSSEALKVIRALAALVVVADALWVGALLAWLADDPIWPVSFFSYAAVPVLVFVMAVVVIRQCSRELDARRGGPPA